MDEVVRYGTADRNKVSEEDLVVVRQAFIRVDSQIV
jgi:hypothetical protein